MKTGRFAHITISNEFLIINFIRIVVLFIAFSFIGTGHTQTEETAVEEPNGVEDAAFVSKLDALLTTVYCYCGCMRETIEVCTCGTAMSIENNFRDRLLAGETVQQIRTDYLDTYGPQYYAVMPVEGINLLAYAMPVIILVFIGGIVFVVLRRSMLQKAATADTHGKSESEVSDQTVKHVEAELEKYKRES